ncbi:unnamed protein product [Onchocerca ochengi]|uniref:G protein-coupled receptor n=1 Tax=Onchocerca ochengi TaxID=42157 RepID=A0A182EKV4_ONCOC|nr:unnamed protein product [Onchocerca ochengi]
MSDAIYFYDNRPDDLDYGEINITDRPICADRATLYNPMLLFSYLTTVAAFIIIPFLVYLSFAKVKDGLFNVVCGYCLLLSLRESDFLCETFREQASFKIYKYKPLGVNAVRVGKLRRERLFSFVSYCCATEIVVLPRFFYSIVSVICIYAGCEYQVRQSAFYSIIRQMIDIFHQLNSIITGLITLIALKPYRYAILSIFRKQKPSLQTSSQK